MRTLTLGFCLALAAGPAHAACPPVDALAESFSTRAPAAAVAIADADEARCARDALLARLAPQLGAPVGYKAGLTTKAAQARFGAQEPVLGVLHAGMMLPDGTELPAAFGARPLWEADLLLVVKDEGINAARTREEALAHLSAARPFIELPDLLYAAEVNIDARLLAAANVAARYGVAGADVPLTADALHALAAMRVVASDAAGAVLAEGRGADALGHPLDVVLWVRDALAREGRKLKAGDLVSVGAFTPLTPPKPGQTVQVRYEGLPGDPAVSVRFR